MGRKGVYLDFPGGSDGKASVYNAGDPGLIPGLGRSPGEGNGNPLQYYCLENPMDRGAWWATVQVVKSKLLHEFIMLLLLSHFSRVRLFATPWTVVYHIPPPMGFSRQGYWSGLPFPSPEDLPDPGIKPRSPAL